MTSTDRTRAAPAEDGDEGEPEGAVHEAVGDRMAAGTDESKQVEEVHRHRRDARHGAEEVEDDPRLEDVHRRPAHEEFEDDDEEHLDDAPLRKDAPIGRRLTEAEGDGPGRRMPRLLLLLTMVMRLVQAMVTLGRRRRLWDVRVHRFQSRRSMRYLVDVIMMTRSSDVAQRRRLRRRCAADDAVSRSV